MTLASGDIVRTNDYPLGIHPGIDASGKEVLLPPLTEEERKRAQKLLAHALDYGISAEPVGSQTPPDASIPLPTLRHKLQS